MKKILVIALTALASIFGTTSAEEVVGIKTNLVGDALLSPNLALEIGLAPKWSLDVSGELNLWDVNGHKWKHWVVQPEARYWLCSRFAGHFFGVHALGGQYNFGNIKNSINFLGSDFSKLTDHRYQGWAAGAGIAYGYAWILDKHWNLEAEIGIGWLYTKFDTYECFDCGKKVASGSTHNYFGPTKLALSFVYLF